MEKKNHVGRPTNEEVNERNKKSKTKLIIIIILLLLLGCGIYLFINKDKIDFDSIMGNSASSSSWNYVVNTFEGTTTCFDDNGCFKKKLSTYRYINTCISSDPSIAECYPGSTNNYVYVKAKRVGRVSLVINGKLTIGGERSTTKSVFISGEFDPPKCTVTRKILNNTTDYVYLIKCTDQNIITNYDLNKVIVQFRYRDIYGKDIYGNVNKTVEFYNSSQKKSIFISKKNETEFLLRIKEADRWEDKNKKSQRCIILKEGFITDKNGNISKRKALGGTDAKRGGCE